MTPTLPKIDYSLQAPAIGGAKKWLEDNASESRKFLLAFAYDGVIWGAYKGSLNTSTVINEDTLQQAFLFDEADELRLFRGEDNEWKACLISDQGVANDDKIDEYQLLWGNRVIQEKNAPAGFTPVCDRVQQAMEHTVPLELTGLDLNIEGPRLLVRHFINYDKETGEARIFLSRLVNLGIGPLAEEKFK